MDISEGSRRQMKASIDNNFPQGPDKRGSPRQESKPGGSGEDIE